jgi:alpha-tubulin suppressor-like RCC1 family protein
MKKISRQLFLALIFLLMLQFLSPVKAQFIAGGTGHSIAICADSTINAWGLNDQNELGQGFVSSNSCVCQATAVPVPNISGVAKLSAGGAHTLLLMNNGTVKAFGRNFDNELGNGLQTTTGCFCDLNIVDVIGLNNVIAVSASNLSSLALKDDGTVWGWGSDAFGQLGDGTANATGCYCELAPVQAIGLSNIVTITSGSFHSLALRNDSTLWAWGNNSNGQLRTGVLGNSAVPTQVPISGVVSIAAGQNFSYAVKADGTVWAWGDNYWGQCGAGGGGIFPVQVNDISNVIAVANSFNHAIALKSDSTVWTWGANYSGQLGVGNTSNSSVPQMVQGLSGIVELGGTMGNFCLARKVDGTVWSWGDNTWGSVGNGSSLNQLSPVLVQSLCAMPTQMEEETNSLLLAVYPNPVKAGESISLNPSSAKANTLLQVEIFNALGERIFEMQQTSNLKVNMPAAAGIYFVLVTADGKREVARVVV